MLEREVLQAVVDRAGRGERFAVALVLAAEGSTPRKAGTRAIIDATGAISGTIGGGVVEAEAQRRAAEAIATGRPVVFEMDLGGASAGECEPICGGSIRVLVDPVVERHREAYAAALAYQRARKRCVLVTSVEDGAVTLQCGMGGPPMLLSSGTGVPPVQGEHGRAAHATEEEHGRDARATGEEHGRAAHATGERLVEELLPEPRLVIAGGGHVGQALAAHAHLAGFEVVVIDDRPEFANPSLFPASVTALCAPIAQTLASFPIDPDTFIAIVTRGHRHDAEALAACIHSPAGYIGMIGSRRKVALMRRHFLDSGLATAEQFDRIHAPIGLDIGAQTVPEIAVSIVAQLIAVRRGRQ